MKNWILLAWNAEAASIMALSMAIAVYTEGTVSLMALTVSIACLLWFVLFLSINKEILARWISEGIKKAGRVLKDKLTRQKKKSRRRELVIVTFPGSKS